jgi:hypothetical protein
VVDSAPLDQQLELAQSLRKHGGEQRVMERERQIESYLTQSGLSQKERHAALEDLRAAHAVRPFRDIRVFAGSPLIWARIAAYNLMAGGRWEPANEEEERQLKQVREDFELVQEEFRSAATDKAYGVLMSGAQVIFSSLGQYGIVDATPVDSAIKAVHLGGKSVESQAALWLDKARQVYGESYHRRGAITSRARYAKETDALIGLQERARKAAQVELKARAKTTSTLGAIDMSPAKRGERNRPKDPEHAAAWDALQDARRALDVAWLEAERDNPALAAYRERGGELANLDLGKTGMSGDERLRHTLAPIVQKLVNVHEAIAALEQGKLKPLSLGPVVKATRAQLLIPPGSTFDPAVKAAIEEAGESSWAMKIMDCVMFAMSLTGIGSLAAGAYDLLKEYAKYESDKRLSNTALDATKSISDVDPSLTGLVVAAISMGLSINEVRGIFKEARALKKTMLEGEEAAANAARKELDQLGERHGIPDLADQVEKRELGAAKPTTGGAGSQHPRGSRINPPLGDGPPPRSRPSSFDRGKGARPAYRKDPLPNRPRASGGTKPKRAKGKVKAPEDTPMFTKREIDETVERLETHPPVKGAKLPAPETPPMNLEHVTEEAKEGVRAMLDKRWARNPEFGTRLHAQMGAQLESYAAQGWKIEVEKELGAAIGKGQSVRQFLETSGDPSGLLSSLPKKVLNQTVDNIKPDLLLRSPSGTLMVWDLTSREAAEHLAKTQLYAQILAKDGHLIQIAESYWDDAFVAKVLKAEEAAAARHAAANAAKQRAVKAKK